jgi:hypothetical protein
MTQHPTPAPEGGADEFKTYRIAHITDLLSVPLERRAACLVELLPILEQMDAVVANLNSQMEVSWVMPCIDWVDDGKTDLQINAVAGDKKVTLYDSTKANDAETPPIDA